MTETKFFGQYNVALFKIFDPPAMQNLVTEEFITTKTVLKYLIFFEYNCRKSRTDLEFYYVYYKFL